MKNTIKFLIIIFTICIINTKCFAAETKISEKNQNNHTSIEGSVSDEVKIIDISKEFEEKQKTKEKKEKRKLFKRKKIKKEEVAIKKTEKIEEGSRLDIQSETMDYDPSTNSIIATGNARVYFPEENIKLYAEKIVFNHDENKIKANKNVRINKDGNWMYGDYIIVDLNHGNSLIENPITKNDKITLTAQYGTMCEDKTKAYWGNVKFNDSVGLTLQTRTFGQYFPLEKEFQEQYYQENKLPDQGYKLRAKKVFIKRTKDHDEVLLKSADLYSKEEKVSSLGDINLFSDKEQSYVEINGPELGSLRDFGMFVGYGMVFKLPRSSTLKIAPALVYDSKFGVGVLGRFNSKYNRTEAGYGTSENKFVLRGKQQLTDSWHIDYGVNNYIDDWFVGRRRPEYIAQLVHHKSYDINDIEANFQNRFNFAFAKDYDSNMSTLRGKWQTQTFKNFLTYIDEEKKLDISLGVLGQTSLALYGTGDTQSIMRIGPSIFTRYKNWTQRISYMTTGTYGDSPMEFDRYRYGKSALEFTESLALSKYLSIAYSGIAVLSDDKYDDKLMQESRFYVSVGPPHAKLSVGYDNIRQNTYFDFSMLVGSDKTEVDFEYLELYEPNKKGPENRSKKVQSVNFKKNKKNSSNEEL